MLGGRYRLSRDNPKQFGIHETQGAARAMNTFEYLHLVLVPVAKRFKADRPMNDGLYVTIHHAKSCRVKFMSKRIERNWQKFCAEHELKNDSSLEY